MNLMLTRWPNFKIIQVNDQRFWQKTLLLISSVDLAHRSFLELSMVILHYDMFHTYTQDIPNCLMNSLYSGVVRILFREGQ